MDQAKKSHGLVEGTPGFDWQRGPPIDKQTNFGKRCGADDRLPHAQVVDAQEASGAGKRSCLENLEDLQRTLRAKFQLHKCFEFV